MISKIHVKRKLVYFFFAVTLHYMRTAIKTILDLSYLHGSKRSYWIYRIIRINV